MKAQNALAHFLNDESGAVTVDWIVLTAAALGLAIAAFTVIETSTGTVMEATSTQMGTQDAVSVF